MVHLSNWKYDGVMLWGICQGHQKLADGTYIHTSPVVEMELCEEGLDAHTYSGTHYRMQTNEVSLDFLEETKKGLEVDKIDTSFLDDVVRQVEEVQKQKEQEVDKLLEEHDLYLEFVGTHMKYGYFKNDGVVMALRCDCHVGMFDDSYLIRQLGVVDVRYFKDTDRISFYHVSDGINNIHFKYIGKVPFTIAGIGDGLEFTQEDSGIKTIKPENCKEGLFSPDCVNGKSAISSFVETKDMEENEDFEQSFQEWVESLSDEAKEKIVNLEDCEELSWIFLSRLTKKKFKMLLERGEKLKVTIHNRYVDCSNLLDAMLQDGYLLLYKSGDNYKMDYERKKETLLCTDDFEYICKIVKTFNTYNLE